MPWSPMAFSYPPARFRFCRRCPFALEKMCYDDKSGMVIYRSKLKQNLSAGLKESPQEGAALVRQQSAVDLETVIERFRI